MPGVSLTRRLVGAASRRLERPELMASFYAAPRQALREEIAIAAILAAGLRGDSTYVDVGANRGQILREAVRLAPRGRHVAFEPIPGVAAELAAAFPAVECRQMALGSSPGEASFCHFRKLEGWSGLRRSPDISDDRGDPEFIAVAVSTLDAELAGSDPSVLKIDVEGAELDVVRGGRELLARARPLVVFEHVASASLLYGASSGELWDEFAELGYETLSVSGDGPFDRDQFSAQQGIVNWLARPAARS
jgi:FkbM family methyltransferase